jgi:hypothetical protein
LEFSIKILSNPSFPPKFHLCLEHHPHKLQREHNSNSNSKKNFKLATWAFFVCCSQRDWMPWIHVHI